MGKYNITKLTRRFFPWFWQTDLNLRFIDILQSSLNETNNNILTNEEDFKQKVGYSIQRLSLETSLNDRFDSELRRIQVVNGDIGGNEFIFNEVETPSPELIIYAWNEAEGGQNDPDFFNENETGGTAVTGFTVFISTELQPLEQQIKSWIDRVLITGIEYNITFV